MTHPAAAWGGKAGDIGDHRLAHMVADELGGLGLFRPADLAVHLCGLCVRVGFEQFEDVPERASVDRVAANPDAGRNAEAAILKLRRRLITECARSSDDADGSGLVDVPGHDAEHCLAGAD